MMKFLILQSIHNQECKNKNIKLYNDIDMKPINIKVNNGNYRADNDLNIELNFPNVVKLKYLNMYTHYLEDTHIIFPNTLEHLIIRGKFDKFIPPDNLKKLEIMYSKMKTFEIHSNILIELNLSDNLLEVIVIDAPKLKTLDISINPLKVVPPLPKNLKNLDISECNELVDEPIVSGQSMTDNSEIYKCTKLKIFR